ncbi:MAG: BON domain-containing protein [Gammaproteobacteria bacterium]
MSFASALRALFVSGLFACSACAPLLVGGAATTGAMVAVDPRTGGTLVEDQAIEMRAAEALRSDSELREQTHVSITSYNQVVLLTGQAPSQALRRRTVDIVREVAKVRHVFDEIAIGAPSSLLSRSNDGVLTTRVKTGLIADSEVPATRIKVVTENASVFLMGIVSRRQGDRAANIASETPGVKRVVKLFEYPSDSVPPAR